VVAIGVEMGSWRDLEPDSFAAAAYVSMALGLVAVGAAGGWAGVLGFFVTFWLAAAVEETWVYEEPVPYACDPFCSSPAAGIYAMPFFLVIILGGMGGRAILRAVRRRPSAPVDEPSVPSS
jgi:hypothetical protein